MIQFFPNFLVHELLYKENFINQRFIFTKTDVYDRRWISNKIAMAFCCQNYTQHILQAREFATHLILYIKDSISHKTYKTLVYESSSLTTTSRNELISTGTLILYLLSLIHISHANWLKIFSAKLKLTHDYFFCQKLLIVII